MKPRQKLSRLSKPTIRSKLVYDPMIALREIQQALNSGISFDHRKLSDGYITINKEFPDGGKTNSYVKIIDGEVQALAIFADEEPINNVDRYSVGYAVSEIHRGRGLGVEAVDTGIEQLKKKFGLAKIKSFYVEALIDVLNSHSINIAKKIFPGSGVPSEDQYTRAPALLFYKLIVI